MNSLKNTIVAILLLGVSYGVYQVLTKPEPKSISTAEFHALTEPQIELPGSIPEPPPAIDSDDYSTPSVGLDASPTQSAAPISTTTLGPPAAPPSSATPHVERPASPLANESPVPPAPWSAPSANKPNSPGEKLSPPLLAGGSQSSPPPFGSTASGSSTSGNRGNEFPTAPLNGPQAPQLSAAPLVELGSTESNPSAGIANPAETNIPAQSASGSIGLTAATAPLPTLENSLQTARQLVAAGQMRQALAELTTQLQNSGLTPADQSKLYTWLDTLAGKVIYSTEHLVQSQPHIVQANETLASLADAWRVPQQLVYNINREKITNPFELQPGTELKQVTGPFRAEIDRQSQTVTLYLESLYAGRFKCVSLSPDIPMGVCRVENKMESGHPAGQFFLQTGSPTVSLHAQPAAGQPSGCCFTQGDARDLFSILSIGSEIKVTR